MPDDSDATISLADDFTEYLIRNGWYGLGIGSQEVSYPGYERQRCDPQTGVKFPAMIPPVAGTHLQVWTSQEGGVLIVFVKLPMPIATGDTVFPWP